MTQIGFNEKYDFTYPAAIIQGITQCGDSIIISGFVGDHIAPYPNRSFIGVANQQGYIQHFQILDSTNKDYWIYPASVSKSKLGNYYFTSGIFEDTVMQGVSGFIWKLDSTLKIIFTKEYYPTHNLDNLTIESHVEYNDDTLALLCTLFKHDNQGNFYDTDILLILTDSVGNELKRLQYGLLDYQEDCLSLQKCNKGLLSASYKIKRFNDNGVWKLAFYPNVLLYDIQGNILKSYNTPSLDYRSSLWAIPTQDNSYIFCGGRYYNVLDPLGTPNQAQLYVRGYIEKLDANFVKQWGLVLGKDSGFTRFNKIIETQNGNYIAVGNEIVVYRHNFSPDSVQIDSAKVEGWAVKISPLGNVIWNRHYLTLTCKGDHIFSDVLEQADGSLVMCGVAYDETPGSPNTNGWLVKTDSFGCIVPGCQLVGITENTPIEHSFKLYPNPASDRLFLYYHNPQLQNCVFAVRDIAGRQLVPPTPMENSTTYEMRVRDWAKGLYFVEVRDEKGNVFTEKFVKE